MTNASRDNDFVPTLTAVLNSDGATVISVAASFDHKLKVSDGTSGTDNGPINAKHDENHVPTLLAVSSLDGVTPIPVYSDANGRLLVSSQ